MSGMVRGDGTLTAWKEYENEELYAWVATTLPDGELAIRHESSANTTVSLSAANLRHGR
jgi:hypothetical protein